MTPINSLLDLHKELAHDDSDIEADNIIDLINIETKRLCSTWFEAERIIKQCEKMSDQLKFPSVNELRYAGRRIVHALSTLDNSLPDSLRDKSIWQHRPANIEGEASPPTGPQGDVPEFELKSEAATKAYSVLRDIIEATENCQKAAHDAIDEIFVVLKRKITAMENTYGYEAVSLQIGEWQEIQDLLFTVVAKMSESRNGSFKLRSEIYFEIEQKHLERAVQLYEIVDKDNRVLAAKEADRKRQEHDDARKHFQKTISDNNHRLFSYAIGLTSLVLGLVSLYLS